MPVKSKSNRSTAARLFDDMVRCETRLYNALSVRLRESHGIVATQFEGLRYIRDHPESRVADLAANFAIGIGATSKVIDRLENEGWVRRIPNPADRRSSLIALTARGSQLVNEAERTFTDCVTDLIVTALTQAQLDTVVDALAILRTTLELDQIGTPVG